MKRIFWMVLAAMVLMGAGCDKQKEQIVVIKTEFGDMHVLLYDSTPKHKANFLKLASEGFYDSTTFHRVIKGFMIQGGDENSKDDNPRNDGQGGPGYTIPAEIREEYMHKKGALAAARMGDNVNPNKESSGSQFYIVQGQPYTDEQLTTMEDNINLQEKNRLLSEYIMDPQNYKDLEELRHYQQGEHKDSINILVERLRPIAEKGWEPFKFREKQREAYKTIGGAPHLDGGYTVFGEVLKGLEVIDKIADQKTARGDRPVKDVKMVVEIVEMKRKNVTDEYGYTYPETAE